MSENVELTVADVEMELLRQRIRQRLANAPDEYDNSISGMMSYSDAKRLHARMLTCEKECPDCSQRANKRSEG